MIIYATIVSNKLTILKLLHTIRKLYANHLDYFSSVHQILNR